MRRRRFWGWGFADEGPEPVQLQAIAGALGPLLGMEKIDKPAPPRVEDLELRAPRVQVPSSLAGLVTTDPFERASHSYGKSYRDLVRALRRDFSNPPDIVALPETEQDIVNLLDFCASNGVAVIPYGGGSSVCGGVEPVVGDGFAGTLSLDLRHLDRVLAIDRTSRAARIQAGVLGPSLEDQLRPHGLTLRHYPQSFEFSSLGGWIATRSGGHFATLYTHIDELVEGLRLVTPSGIVQTRRVPASGAGPAPERLFIGSEGILGVIVEAWMRVFERPRFRASLTARFVDFFAGASALRLLAQSGLHPANCRLLDPLEALLNGAGSGDRAVLLVGFESSDHPLDAWLARAAEICRSAGGEVSEGVLTTNRDDSRERRGEAGAWRNAFLRAPYLRDELIARGVLVETCETAVTWDRFEQLQDSVMHAARESAGRSGNAIVTCRITHAYADGAAPYFTVIAAANRGAELEQWSEVKTAVTEAILGEGGTTTHHHGIGRDFQPFYQRERSEGFARALEAVKRELDPKGVLNPGVLLGPPSTGDARRGRLADET